MDLGNVDEHLDIVWLCGVCHTQAVQRERVVSLDITQINAVRIVCVKVVFVNVEYFDQERLRFLVLVVVVIALVVDVDPGNVVQSVDIVFVFLEVEFVKLERRFIFVDLLITPRNVKLEVLLTDDMLAELAVNRECLRVFLLLLAVDPGHGDETVIAVLVCALYMFVEIRQRQIILFLLIVTHSDVEQEFLAADVFHAHLLVHLQRRRVVFVVVLQNRNVVDTIYVCCV
mmetsp:Transcript_69398/g.110228  ORF Transcript_69398/g.110228 Transcript_69398/m.110228 type:complete len:229 (-) Transcript_69398:767-1453(-)